MVELKRDGYPRSNEYDADWVLAGDMGPHPLWLLEDLVLWFIETERIKAFRPRRN